MEISKSLIRHIIYIGTYPPRQCGIATFTQDLLKNMQLLEPTLSFGVFAMNQHDTEGHSYPPEVVGQIVQNDRAAYLAAAEQINQLGPDTLVIIQHEYGIYQGDYLIALMNELRCPIVTTFHTVVVEPSAAMRQLTERIIAASDRVVTLTDASHALLASLYPEARTKGTRLLHGIHPLIFTESASAKPALDIASHQVLLTFGLLGRNKGIEHVIRAMPAIVARFPAALYLIVGGTHPNVLHTEGETYRDELTQLVKTLAIEQHVRFVNSYLSTDKVLAYLQATDIYIAPSIDPHQAVSGTLSYALGTGRAVVATEFAQAKEIIHPGVGITVPIGEPARLAEAIIRLLDDPEKLRAMHRTAYHTTRSMLWPNVADGYLALATNMRHDGESTPIQWPEPVLHHLETLTDGFGLIQFAKKTNPDQRSGYTLDDNCRALQALDKLAQTKPELLDQCNQLAIIYLKVVERCLTAPKPANYLAATNYAPTRQNMTEDLEDSFARAAYALETIAAGPLAVAKSAQLLRKHVPQQAQTSYLRPAAFRLLGACIAFENGHAAARTTITTLADRLVAAYQKNTRDDWHWFEPTLTYANGILCASLLEAARLTGKKIYQEIGLRTLEFLCQTCFMGEVYVPIGQAGWYPRGSDRALFDQQPEDVAAMLQALVSAYRLTNNKLFSARGAKAFSWFMGNNLLGARMYDDVSGGCHDGLTPYGPNANEGAESTLSYLMARLLLEHLVVPSSAQIAKNQPVTLALEPNNDILKRSPA